MIINGRKKKNRKYVNSKLEHPPEGQREPAAEGPPLLGSEQVLCNVLKDKPA